MGLGFLIVILLVFSAYVSNADIEENLKVGTNVVIAVIFVAIILFTVILGG